MIKAQPAFRTIGQNIVTGRIFFLHTSFLLRQRLIIGSNAIWADAAVFRTGLGEDALPIPIM
jgi:hypothetical protein